LPVTTMASSSVEVCGAAVWAAAGRVKTREQSERKRVDFMK
jgi:hypothetical protein